MPLIFPALPLQTLKSNRSHNPGPPLKHFYSRRLHILEHNHESEPVIDPPVEKEPSVVEEDVEEEDD